MGFFKSVISGAINAVALPVAVVADIATLGGATIDRKESFTATQIKAVTENVDDALEELP